MSGFLSPSTSATVTPYPIWIFASISTALNAGALGSAVSAVRASSAKATARQKKVFMDRMLESQSQRRNLFPPVARQLSGRNEPLKNQRQQKQNHESQADARRVAAHRQQVHEDDPGEQT